MRKVAPLLLFVAMLGCRAKETVPEAGAILLDVRTEEGTAAPDELRAWVYGDTGMLWSRVRIPAEGPLQVQDSRKLGTILVQPGPVKGSLRIHLRAFSAGVRISDGTLSIANLAGDNRTFPITLTAALPKDDDADDVPDAIDDCPGVGNPSQGGCPPAAPPDAGSANDALSPSGPDAGTQQWADSNELPKDSVQRDEGAPDTVEPPDGFAADRVASQPDLRAGQDTTDLPRLADVTAERIERDANSGADQGPPKPVDASTPDVAIPDAPAPDVASDVGTDLDAVVAPACPDGGLCDKTQGALCANNGECASGFCADGVCCTNTCVGPCRSCNQPSATGVCQGYAAGTDPEAECGSASSCNGVGACGPSVSPDLPNGQLCTAGSQCRSGHCTDGVCCDSACSDPCQTCGTGVCQSVKKADDVPECTGNSTCNPRGMCVAR